MVYILAMKDSLTIGKLAKAAQVNVETVRFYERKGILTQPKKQGGFRYYPKEYVDRLLFIKKAQALGFTLRETTELLNLKINNRSKCSDVLEKTEEKIEEINQKIKDLRKMKKSLEGLALCCIDENQALSECPILECFVKQNGKNL